MENLTPELSHHRTRTIERLISDLEQIQSALEEATPENIDMDFVGLTLVGAKGQLEKISCGKYERDSAMFSEQETLSFTKEPGEIAGNNVEPSTIENIKNIISTIISQLRVEDKDKINYVELITSFDTAIKSINDLKLPSAINVPLGPYEEKEELSAKNEGPHRLEKVEKPTPSMIGKIASIASHALKTLSEKFTRGSNRGRN